MGIFEDFTSFFESRLDEFLQSNPQLNLTILTQELKAEKQDTLNKISRLESELKVIEKNILELGNEIKIWFERIEKAKNAGRLDLAQEAENRQNSLLKKGNLYWTLMEENKQKIIENKELLISIEAKQQEVNLKIAQLKEQELKNSARSTYNKYSENSDNYSNSFDDLEAKFAQWEIEQELQELKKKI